MSIFDTLVESGVTQEDLEKAASARLFAEAAAAEGIDLSELTEDQAEELYDFWANNEVEAEKAASANAFFEAAAAEGIDLNELTEDQVGELYEFWANGGEEKVASAEDLLAEAAVKEASAKLAEAEYIGRYMARVYADEMDKIAKEEGPEIRTSRGIASGVSDEAKSLYDRMHKGMSGESLGKRFKSLKKTIGATDIAEGYKALRNADKLQGPLPQGAKHLDAAGRAAALKQLGKGGLRAGLTAGAVGAAGYGAKKLHDAHKKESSALDEIVEARALELLEEAAYEKVADRTATEAAKELLTAKHVRKNVSDVAGHGASAWDKAKTYAKILRGKAGNKMMTSEARKSLAAQAGLAAGVGAAGYGAKKLHDAHKKESSAFEELALVRAYELLEEAEAENELDEAAFELLRANGYDV